CIAKLRGSDAGGWSPWCRMAQDAPGPGPARNMGFTPDPPLVIPRIPPGDQRRGAGCRERSVTAIAAPAAHSTAVHVTVAPVEVWSATTPASHGPAVCPAANRVVSAAIVAVQSCAGTA